MMQEDQTAFFEHALFSGTGQELSLKRFEFISGGSINNAVKLVTEDSDFFLKWNESKPEHFFEAEAKNLDILRKTGVVRTPEVFSYGRYEGKSFLLLSFIESLPGLSEAGEEAGRRLAELHRQTSHKHGLSYNNYIGSFPQNNDPDDDWISFFTEKRLHAQIGLCYYKGLVDDEFMKKAERFYVKVRELLPQPEPSLLHGDLWAGNLMTNRNGKPYFIDPAVYFGHRETDLAFTRLFGGFNNQFYEAYKESYPLETGFKDRADIYNLYPLLVHTNLFGTSYLSGVNKVFDRYL